MTDTPRLPGNTAYVLRDGTGPAHLVAGQVMRTLAGVEETVAGKFGWRWGHFLGPRRHGHRWLRPC